MSKEPNYDHLRERQWRRQLDDTEEAELQSWLAAHPEARADWEAEAGLTAALNRLPEAAVPSNFTARVVQAAEREMVAGRHGHGLNWVAWLRLRWLPKSALTATAVGAGVVSCLVIQGVQRRNLVESVAVVSSVPTLPTPDILKDFDAIRAANPAAVADEQLLTVLQ